MRRLPPRLLASIPHASPWGAVPLLLSSSVANHTLQNIRAGPRSRAVAQWQCHPQWQQQRAGFLTGPASCHPADNDTSRASPSPTIAREASTSPTPTLPGLEEAGHDEQSPAGLHEDGITEEELPNLPFRFDTGIGLYAKRPPRPFPPPFLSPPSGSFSDPLSTHDRSRDRRAAYVNGKLIRGYTNGDDAVFASKYFVCANDGVGAWSTRPRGHAGLWSRLILHFWASAVFEDAVRQGDTYCPDPIAYLQQAYEQTMEATASPNDWQGTTTVAGAQLHYRHKLGEPGQDVAESDKGSASGGATNLTDGDRPSYQSTDSAGHAKVQGETEKLDNSGGSDVEPLLYVTNLGDSQVMVVRPSTREIVYKSTEQWHWFDCPRQLGTNSPDTPRTIAVVDEVPIQEGDVVLAMSDGVIDNLWSHEISEKVCECIEKWRAGEVKVSKGVLRGTVLDNDAGMMGFVAEELMEAAKAIALDPYAESPFMEHAIEEGLASEGGKPDDISVVAAICKRND